MIWVSVFTQFMELHCVQSIGKRMNRCVARSAHAHVARTQVEECNV